MRGRGLLAALGSALALGACAVPRVVDFAPPQAGEPPAPKNIHEGRGGNSQCQGCHLRGEPVPALLRGEPMALCLGCHKQSHAGNHPVGVAMKGPSGKAPVWKGTVTCVSCHDPHAIRVEKGFRGLVSDTCLECHRQHVKGKSG